MPNPVFRYTGALVVAGAILLPLRARPNASLLQAASSWSMVLHALLGAKQTRRNKK